ncbi:MAG: OsmC family protein [Thermomicrobiales bacterium]
MATATQMINGVDVDRLGMTIDAMKQNPELALFQFRGESRWESGARCTTTFESFYGAGTENQHRRKHVLEGDEPDILLGVDSGPNAVETLLGSLASCLAVGYAYNAAARGIPIEVLLFQVEGNLDLQAFLGLSNTKRPGYESIRVEYQVTSPAPRDELLELCDYVQKTSPVFDMITNKVPVSVELTA